MIVHCCSHHGPCIYTLERLRIWRGNENTGNIRDLPTYHISAHRCSISREEDPLNCPKTPLGGRLFSFIRRTQCSIFSTIWIDSRTGCIYLVIYLFPTFCDPVLFISPPNAKGFKGLGYVGFLYFQSQRREH